MTTLDNRDHRELPTASTGSSGLSALSTPCDDADYRLFTDNNDKKDAQSPPSPGKLHTTTNRNDEKASSTSFSSKKSQPKMTIARVVMVPGDVPPHLEMGRVEGFILSKHPCAPNHHLYHRFRDFPAWNRRAALRLPTKPTTTESSLLSDMDDELWNEFSPAFSNDLIAGDRNFRIFQCSSAAMVIALAYLACGTIDPFLFVVVLLLFFCLLYEALRPSLFDLVDRTVARYQTRFAEMGVRATVVYYSIQAGRLRSNSRYLVFTALPHPRTLDFLM